MSRYLSLGALFGFMAVSTSTLAEPRYVAADGNVGSKLCVSAATDRTMQFRSKVQDSGTDLLFVANRVTCNDIPIAQFAHTAGNDRNFGMLRNYHFPIGTVEIREAAVRERTESRWARTEDSGVIRVQGKFLE